uniref:Uncharacterized protein n=1 Tax=Chromera velia CCMP2878 TaxID=1169474 RepID=A0A0G4H7I3_9ALVE|eukprot:Cvel_5839.t1-p1 / transcript=Cvel_5839.t1 / gene=Cvel_5839 / organism=Chromera_velia_CCMP2878 / gene_product=Putative ankyrin repeat protein RF_0381, putative / transcript_product=Putative ankyrin repeat protein RF_0381, putative / location=Cvel_scaffold277:87985-93629(-) / protein_length=665 / sequence_SO=supercontig / SO=protein_coding / is_pseudo=false
MVGVDSRVWCCNSEGPLFESLEEPLGRVAVQDSTEWKVVAHGGRPVDPLSHRGQTCLFTAIKRDDLHLFRALLEGGAGIDSRDKEGRQSLHIAVETGNIPFVDLLLDLGADVNAKDKNWRQPLHMAVEHGDSRLVQTLLSRGADVNVRDRTDGLTPLMRAASTRNRSVVRTLLQAGAQTDLRDENLGDTALHFGVAARDPGVCLELLHKGAHVDLRNKWGWTPLAIAHNSLLDFGGRYRFCLQDSHKEGGAEQRNSRLGFIVRLLMLNGATEWPSAQLCSLYTWQWMCWDEVEWCEEGKHGEWLWDLHEDRFVRRDWVQGEAKGIRRFRKTRGGNAMWLYGDLRNRQDGPRWWRDHGGIQEEFVQRSLEEKTQRKALAEWQQNLSSFWEFTKRAIVLIAKQKTKTKGTVKALQQGEPSAESPQADSADDPDPGLAVSLKALCQEVPRGELRSVVMARFFGMVCREERDGGRRGGEQGSMAASDCCKCEGEDPYEDGYSDTIYYCECCIGSFFSNDDAGFEAHQDYKSRHARVLHFEENSSKSSPSSSSPGPRSVTGSSSRGRRGGERVKGSTAAFSSQSSRPRALHRSRGGASGNRGKRGGMVKDQARGRPRETAKSLQQEASLACAEFVSEASEEVGVKVDGGLSHSTAVDSVVRAWTIPRREG